MLFVFAMIGAVGVLFSDILEKHILSSDCYCFICLAELW